VVFGELRLCGKSVNPLSDNVGGPLPILPAENSNVRKIGVSGSKLLPRPLSSSVETPGQLMAIFTHLDPGTNEGGFFQLLLIPPLLMSDHTLWSEKGSTSHRGGQ
jgi:hypothetical protein